MSDATATRDDLRMLSDVEPLLCPMCDYDLRGQPAPPPDVAPRCPECGYPYDFEELRDPTRRQHPYLFEHHPRRNIRSFIATLIGVLIGGVVGAYIGYLTAPKVIETNHKQMARWIDHQMNNDFVRGVIEEDWKKNARELLALFYAAED